MSWFFKNKADELRENKLVNGIVIAVILLVIHNIRFQ